MDEDEMDSIVEKRAKEMGLTKGEVVKRYLLEKIGASPPEGNEQGPSTVQEFKEMLMAQSMREMMNPKKEGEGSDTDRMFNRLLMLRIMPEEKRETKSTMDKILEYKAMKDMFREGDAGKEREEGTEKSTMDKILEYRALRDLFGDEKDVPSEITKRMDELRDEFMGKRVGEIETSVKREMDGFRELLTKGKRDEAVEVLANRIMSFESKLDTAQKAVAGGAPSKSTVQVMSEALKEQREFQEEMLKFAESQGMTKAEIMKGGKINWGKVMDRAFGLGEKVIESIPGRTPPKGEVIPIPETQGSPPEPPTAEAPPEAPPEASPEAPPEAPPESPPERYDKLGLTRAVRVPEEKHPEAPPEQPQEAPPEEKPTEEGGE